jgi:hypothetical protein
LVVDMVRVQMLLLQEVLEVLVAVELKLELAVPLLLAKVILVVQVLLLQAAAAVELAL